MFMKTILATTASTALLATGALAQQQGPGLEETGLYGGIAYSFLDLETDSDIGDNTNALTGRLGWQITPNFALEGEASFGIDDGSFDFDAEEEDINFDDNQDGDLDDALAVTGDIGLDYLIGAFGKYTYPISDEFDLFARAGYAFVEIDATAEIAGEEFGFGASESGFAFGVGGAYDVAETQSIRLDYTRYEFEDANIDGVTIAYELKF
jgi:opacity protein-like surface antigen